MVMLDTMSVEVIPACASCPDRSLCDEPLDGELPEPLLLELPERGEVAEPDDMPGVVVVEAPGDRVPVTRTR